MSGDDDRARRQATRIRLTVTAVLLAAVQFLAGIPLMIPGSLMDGWSSARILLLLAAIAVGLVGSVMSAWHKAGATRVVFCLLGLIPAGLAAPLMAFAWQTFARYG